MWHLNRVTLKMAQPRKVKQNMKKKKTLIPAIQIQKSETWQRSTMFIFLA